MLNKVKSPFSFLFYALQDRVQSFTSGVIIFIEKALGNCDGKNFKQFLFFFDNAHTVVVNGPIKDP